MEVKRIHRKSVLLKTQLISMAKMDQQKEQASKLEKLPYKDKKMGRIFISSWIDTY